MLAVQSFGFSLIALIIKTPDRAEKNYQVFNRENPSVIFFITSFETSVKTKINLPEKRSKKLQYFLKYVNLVQKN